MSWKIKFLCGQAAAILAGVIATAPAYADDTNLPARNPSANEQLKRERYENLRAVAGNRDRLRKFEENLNSSFKGIDVDQSPRSLSINPRQTTVNPATPSKRMQDLIDRRREWMYLTPEELLSGSSLDDLIGTPENDREKNARRRLSPMNVFIWARRPPSPPEPPIDFRIEKATI